MVATLQEFSFGSINEKFDLIPSKVLHEPQFVYLDDVLQTFQIPDIVKFKANGVTVACMRDDNGMMYCPKRIPCRPGCVIEVIYKTPQYCSTSLSSTTTPGSLVSSSVLVDQLSIKNQVSTDLDPSEPMNTTLSRATTPYIHRQLRALNAEVELANQSDCILTAEAMQGLIRKHLVSATKDDETQQPLMQKIELLMGELKLQGNVIEQLTRKMIDMQQQALDRLTLIQSKTEAILTQQLELTEYPIPRLFIVLPEVLTKYDPANWFRTKFRLHFICECGEHTKATKSRIPNHLHLAKHEGYLVRQPTAFFEKYGPFLLLMLELIKFGSIIAGYTVPALKSLKVVELVDSVQQTVELVTAKIDYSLECIDKRLASSPGDSIDTNESQIAMTQQDLTNYLNNVEGLEGVELRQLASFLRTSEEGSLLGNLYRMVTTDGHVKWVCRDHYRTGYQERQTQKLRDVVKLEGGEFDEQLGRIKITLESSFAATEFYNAISNAKGVLDLDVKLHWNQEYADFVKLKDMVKKSNITSIAVHLYCMTGPKIDLKLITNRRYDPIIEAMRLPFIHSFEIDGVPKDFFKRSSAWPRNADFSSLRHLAIGGLDSDTAIVKFKLLVAQASNLSSLSLNVTLEWLPAVFGSIVEHQSYPIEINKCALRFLPPKSDPRTLNVALKDLTHLFKVHGAQVETLDFRQIVMNDLAVEALAEATQNGSSLRVLSLDGSDGCLSVERSKHLASIISRSELRTLWVKLDKDGRHVRILDSLQWKYIRGLEIRETQNDQEIAMRALVNGMEKMLTTVELEYLLYSDYVVSSSRLELMRRIISMLSLKRLELKATLTLEQTLAICESVNFSRMHYIHLECRRWDSGKTQTILDALQHATQLLTIDLGYGEITEAQIEQMHAKGVKLTQQ
ncbi:hypothetical protein BGX27_001853 [Mortierella sp. AM989]|nr:hypothetical protein BGX27_001853 [Mortierella sp. AM989]